MPWTASEAEKHTHKATTPELQELWAKVANERLEKTGDEGRAIREANSVVARQQGESRAGPGWGASIATHSSYLWNS
jgi:hypothetical protein